MASRIRTHHWEETRLGASMTWPTSLRTVLEVMLGSSQPMFITWGPERLLLYNEAHARLIGAAHPGALGRPFFEVWPALKEDISPVFDAAFSGSPRCIDDTHVVVCRRAGSELHLNFSCSPIHDEEGLIQGVLCVCQDVTARNDALRALRASEARFRAMFEASGVGAAQFEATTGRILQVNDALVDMIGYARHELEGRSFLDLVHPEDRPHAQSRLRRLIAGEVAHEQGEKRIIRKDTTTMWVFASVSILPETPESAAQSVALMFDVSDRKQVEQTLEEASRRKDEYLAMLGHELRNPLAAIRGAAELVKLSRTADPYLRRAYGVLDRQSSHMARLIDGLLDVSRLVRGKVQLEKHRIDLRSVLDAAVQDRAEHVERRGLQLRVELPSSPVWAQGDHVRLAQVFDNLLGNAIKFTDPPGVLTVSLHSQADSAVVRVRDTGAGIREELLERIFEPFHQETQDPARAAGGLGLGLALSRGLVELHDGEIRARSEGTGAGAEFEVRLPLAEAPAETDLERPAAAVSANRILVVEDNPDTAEMLRDLLALRGHDVSLATNGHEALQILRSQEVDEVLCDLGLPGMSGYELARTIRETSALHDIPLVALTGYGQPEDRRRTSDAGFDDHLVKPVDLDSLEQALSRAHAKHSRGERGVSAPRDAVDSAG